MREGIACSLLSLLLAATTAAPCVAIGGIQPDYRDAIKKHRQEVEKAEETGKPEEARPHIKKVFGHVSYLPAAGLGVYKVDEFANRVNETKTADYQAAGDLAFLVGGGIVGAIGLGGYTIKAGEQTENEIHFALYSAGSLGLQVGYRNVNYELTGFEINGTPLNYSLESKGAEVELLLSSGRKKGRPGLTLGLGAFFPEHGDALPSISLASSIPLAGNFSLDLSVWAMNQQYDVSSYYSGYYGSYYYTDKQYEQWDYRWSAGLGLSF